jgi:16S rRNA processing protein RimM
VTSFSQNPSAWFALADLLRPQGRRGELLATPLTDLTDAFRADIPVWLAKSGEPAASAAPVTLEAHWLPTGRNAGRIVLKLSNANSINEAEALSGHRVFLPAQAAPKLDEDTYFVRDLIGCTLLNGDTPVGEIIDLEFPTAPDGRTRLEDAAPLLVVELPTKNNADENESDEANELLIPFIRAWITNADIPNKRLQMNLPEGLLEAEI